MSSKKNTKTPSVKMTEGNIPSTSKVDPATKEILKNRVEKALSVLSTRTHVTAKIAQMDAIVAEKVQEKVAYKNELAQAHLAKCIELGEWQCKFNQLQDEYDDLSEEGNEVKRGNLKIQIDRLKRDISAKTYLQDHNNEIFESLSKKIDAEIDVIKKQGEAVKEALKIEQDAEQDLPSSNDGDEEDPIVKWVADAAKIDATAKLAEQKKIAEEHKAQELAKEEERQLQEIRDNFCQRRNQEGIPTPVVGASAQVMPNNTMQTQFLARQSHSKDLPTFSGHPDEWLGFKAAYDRTNRVCGFTDDENLGRLERCLEGAAEKLVRFMLTTPANVPHVMRKLEMIFGQPDKIIKSVTDKLRSTPALKPDQLESIVDFGCAVDNLTYTLLALNRPECLRNPILIEELELKLPVSWRMEWRLWLDAEKKSSDLSTFAAWIERKTRVASALCPPKNSGPREKQDWGRNRNRRPGEKVFVASEPAEKPRSGCACCGIMGIRVQDCAKFKKMSIKDRLQIVKQKRLCFKCLNFGHISSECRGRINCGQEGCKGKHHRLIHENRKPQPLKEEDKQENVAIATNEIVAKASVVCSCKARKVIYKFVEVTLLGPNSEEVDVFIILDGGSAYSILDNEVANQLNLGRKRQPFTFGGLGYQGNRPDSDVVEFRIRSHYNNQVYSVKNVQTDDVNYLPCRSLCENDVKKWKHLKDLPLKYYDDAVPKLLLGIEHADLMEAIQRTDGSNGAPIACETKLGWIVTGVLPETLECPRNDAVFFVNEDEDLHQLVKSHFTTEDFGVKVTQDKLRSVADKRALSIMESTARRVDGKWEIGLLWKEDQVNLPESRTMTLKRLYSIEKKMDRSPDFAHLYESKIQEYLDKGFVRKLTAEEIPTESPLLWYLPHFGVTNPNKQGKFRLVNDAKAKSHGVSLNDMLLTGPDFVPSLTAVLFRFRERAIAFTGDISDMFHMVKIREDDQCAQRFLWRGMDRDREPDEMVMKVMMFGAASSPSCAQFIKNLNAEEYQTKFPEAVKDIKDNHYVDDYLASTDTVEQAIARRQQVQEIHHRGGFKICKWISNSAEFNQSIPEELRAEGTKNMGMDKVSFTERILGMHWEPNEDYFTFKTDFHKIPKDVVQGKRIPTKREALGLTMSVYDQFGLLAHFIIKAKMILQMTWRSKVGWDEELPPAVHEQWYNWIKELAGISNFRVPRCYSLNLFKAESVQLHIFTDGSEEAFSAMAYFRVEYQGKVEVVLVAAKAKVAPLKPISIPRMELQGAVLGTRLAHTIQEQHEVKVTEKIFWCDSATALKWISSDGRNFKTFVSHRIGELQETTEVSEWRWIPTDQNVADEATRSNKPCDWSPSSRWLNGPEFMKRPRSEWPTERGKCDFSTINLEEFELKKEFLGVTMETFAKAPIDISLFSSWIKLIRSTAMFLMAVDRFKKRKITPSEVPINLNDLIKGLSIGINANVLETADQNWWKWSQKESYPEEYSLLKRNVSLESKSSIFKLTPFIDENGIMRMRSRIPSEAEVFLMEKHPIILHPKHPYTVLLISYLHRKAGHHGMERVVNDLRQRFCIPSVRVAVKRAWSNCQLCKIRRVMPRPPMMGELPLARLQSFVHPFTITGLDYFGPMEVTIGYRRREKRYGALFTCMSTRAIHVEVAASLSTDSCIMAIQRFISRRGNPRDLFSDNGKNFVGANNEIKRALEQFDQEKITSEMANRGINWHFITPAAPHMGGAWERKVKSFKVAMAAILHTRAPTEEVLMTLMAEAENTVNGHPLTHVSCDPRDLEALTPNHFLIGRSNNLLSWRPSDDHEKCLKKLWEKAQQLADLFWRRWVQEYLPTLTRRDKWFEEQKPIEVGDVVILVDNTQPRNSWPKGRIVEVFPGKDGQVRTVLVKTATGTYKRPAVKICVLDVRGAKNEDVQRSEDAGPEAVLLLQKICSRDINMKSSQDRIETLKRPIGGKNVADP